MKAHRIWLTFLLVGIALFGARRVAAQPSNAGDGGAGGAGGGGAQHHVEPTATGSAPQPAAGTHPPSDEPAAEADEDSVEGVSAADLDPHDLIGGQEIDQLTEEDLEKLEAAGGEAFEHYKEKAVAFILGVKEKVTKKQLAGIKAKGAKNMMRMSMFLIIFASAGLLLLLMPLFLRKRYPNQGRLLFKYSAFAAGAFAVSIALFGAVLLGLSAVRGTFAEVGNPAVVVVESSFDVLADKVPEYMDMGTELIFGTLKQMKDGEVGDVGSAIFANAQVLAKDASAFKALFNVYKSLKWVLDALPMILSLLAVVLFLIVQKQTLKEIISMPGKVARGEASGGAVQKMVLRRVGWEIVVAAIQVLMLALVAVLTGLTLGFLMYPTMENFIGYLALNFDYVMDPGMSSSALIYVSLLGVMLFLVLQIVIVLVGGVLFVGKLTNIIRARVHDQVAFGTHKKFFLWGSVGFAWLHAFPILFAFLAALIIDKIDNSVGEKDNPWAILLLSGPLIMSVGFLLVFWLARGVKAFAYILKYKPLPPAEKNDPLPAAVPAGAAS